MQSKSRLYDLNLCNYRYVLFPNLYTHSCLLYLCVACAISQNTMETRASQEALLSSLHCQAVKAIGLVNTARTGMSHADKVLFGEGNALHCLEAIAKLTAPKPKPEEVPEQNAEGSRAEKKCTTEKLVKRPGKRRRSVIKTLGVEEVHVEGTVVKVNPDDEEATALLEEHYRKFKANFTRGQRKAAERKAAQATSQVTTPPTTEDAGPSPTGEVCWTLPREEDC